MEDAKPTFKVVLIGDSGVGKTRIWDCSTEEPVSTVGGQCKPIEFPNHGIVLDVWDTAGTERYRSLVPLYARESDAIIVVYDITDRASFEAIQGVWVPWLKEAVTGIDGMKFVLVGNKSDLEERRQVDRAEGEKLAKTLLWRFFETSALKAKDVEHLFTSIADMLAETTLEVRVRARLETTPESDRKSGSKSCCK